MYGSLVYYLDAGVETLDRIRRKYDPTFRLMRPHVPVLFPVPETVGRGRLLEHLDAVVPRLPRFPVRFRGLDKTPDHWMYLKVEDGSADFVRMYEAVYTGPLAPFRRGDVRFVPHVGLGLFVKKNVRYDISAVPAADSFRRALLPPGLERGRLPGDRFSLHGVEAALRRARGRGARMGSGREEGASRERASAHRARDRARREVT